MKCLNINKLISSLVCQFFNPIKWWHFLYSVCISDLFPLCRDHMWCPSTEFWPGLLRSLYTWQAEERWVWHDSWRITIGLTTRYLCAGYRLVSSCSVWWIWCSCMQVMGKAHVIEAFYEMYILTEQSEVTWPALKHHGSPMPALIEPCSTLVLNKYLLHTLTIDSPLWLEMITFQGHHCIWSAFTISLIFQ